MDFYQLQSTSEKVLKKHKIYSERHVEPLTKRQGKLVSNPDQTIS